METDYTVFTHIDMPAAERKKLDIGNIYMNVAKCTRCGWIIRSKNRHDYQTCKCGAVSVDGGSWYVGLAGDLDNAEPHTVYYKELHKDK